MEPWFIIVISLCISFLAASIFSLSKRNLPPGPPVFPIIGNLLWLRNPISHIESILRRLKPRYGPLITLTIGTRSFIFVGTHSLAYKALVQNGAVFSNRPAPPPTSQIMNRSQISISGTAYGPTWRLLRRNLTHQIRLGAYSASRRRVLSLLIRRLLAQSESSVTPIDHFQHAMLHMLALMCFGDELHENQIGEIEEIHRKLILNFRRFNPLDIFPQLGKLLFRNRLKEMVQLREEQDRVLIPLIRARLNTNSEDEEFVPYVDTLVDLDLPKSEEEEEQNRKLNEDEIVGLCSELLIAGTDTTSTALQWIFANLVKYPQIQNKLYQEITNAAPKLQIGTIEEEELQKLPYLKAVVLEGLRRHPPAHLALPHRTSDNVELEGYLIPRDATVNFMVADLGWDPSVWEDPMEFRPERFLGDDGEGFDVTCSREIKMMPFGAGRRICPGYGVALLHLEYFVANLIWGFEWRRVEGDEVDLEEKHEFTTVMKTPLKARISPRTRFY